MADNVTISIAPNKSTELKDFSISRDIKVSSDKISTSKYSLNTDNIGNKKNFDIVIDAKDNESKTSYTLTDNLGKSDIKINPQENEQNSLGFSFLPQADDFKISILGNTKQNLYSIDEEKARNSDISVVNTAIKYYKTISVDNIFLNDIDNCITVKDPYIEQIKDYFEKLEDQTKNMQSNSKISDSSISINVKEKASLSSLKSEKQLENEKKFIYEFKIKSSVIKASKEFAKTFKEQVDKMKKILKNYEEAIKELLGNEVVEDKKAKNNNENVHFYDSKDTYSYVFNEQKNTKVKYDYIKQALNNIKESSEKVPNITINSGDSAEAEAVKTY